MVRDGCRRPTDDGSLLVLARGANLLSFRKERPTQVAAWAGRRSSDRELLSHKGCW